MPTYSNDIAEKNVLLNVLTKNEQFKTINMNVSDTKIDANINTKTDHEIKNDTINVKSAAIEVSKEDNLIDFWRIN